MESLDLRIFREVAAAHSISEAARTMGYVQSNITNHIHNLEEELQTRLLIRNSKGVRLTAAGERLLPYAERIVDMLDEAGRQFAAQTSDLKIGAVPTVAAHRLPNWLAKYEERFPGSRFSVITDSQANLIEAVAGHTIDCAWINSDYENEACETVLSFVEQVALIAAFGVDEEVYIRQSLIVSKRVGCPYRRLLEDWVMKRTGRLPQVIEYETVEGIIQSVSLGLGISLLPLDIVKHASGIQIHELSEEAEVRIHLITAQRAENPYMEQFVNFVRDDCGR